jgi:hypothetical protein
VLVSFDAKKSQMGRATYDFQSFQEFLAFRAQESDF